MTRGYVSALLVACALATTAADKAPRPVEIKVLYGHVFGHKATVRLRVTVAPHKDNRGLWVAIEAAGYASAHYEELPADRAAHTREVEFKDLPDGAYTAWARLLREHGEPPSARETFLVGQSDSEDPFP